MRLLMQEIKFALRQLRKSPVFALVAMLTLALGIGANTAVFTLLDQVLLRSLPVSHPEQLVRLRYTGDSPGHTNSFGGDDNDFFSYPMYRDLRDKNGVMSGLIANDEQDVAVQWNNKPFLANLELASGNYFEVLGIQPAIGRLILPSDEALNAAPVVVLSFNSWKTQFGSDPRVLDQTFLINAHPFTIVGVAPPKFHSLVAGATPELFVPLTAKNLITPRWQDLEDRRSMWLTITGRLKPGVSRQAAEAGLNPLWHALRAEEFKDFKHQDRWRKPFLEESRLQVLDSARGFSPLRDQIGLPLLVLMGMVGLLALMTCVNLSSLLLVRAAGRAREISLRYALGAGRWQVSRQLLTEGLLLGLLGGGLGLVLAPVVSRILIRRLTGEAGNDLAFSPNPDWRVLLFTLGLALLISLALSLAPAFRFLRPDLVNSLKQQSATGGASHLRFRRLSVAVQIGLSLLLLVGAGLFVRTLRNLQSADVGFTTGHLVMFGVNPRLAGYPPEQTFALYKRVTETLAALPGTRSVGGTDDPDLEGSSKTTGVTISGSAAKDDTADQVEDPAVTAGFLATMEIPLLAGRALTDQDVAGKSNVAIVSAAFAKRYFGEPRNAVGRMLNFDGVGSNGGTEIVGVAGDTKHTLRGTPQHTVYRPAFQMSEPDALWFYVRTWQPADNAVANVRTAMQQLDSKLALTNLRSVDEQIARNLGTERLIALLSVSFGVLAMLLAGLGLYGVLAYATAQRTREIGIRMALGAQRSGVVRLVLRDVLWMAALSIAVTIPVAMVLSRLLRSQLYGVSSSDPLTIVLGTVLVGAVVLIAALLPARRAASTNPVQALRSE